MSFEQDLTFPQGVDYGEVWPVDQNGTPANLMGWSAVCEVRDAPNGGGNLLHTFTCSIQENYKVAIQYTAEESLLWEWTFGFYDVKLVNGSDRPIGPLVRGTISILPIISLGT